MIAILLGRPQGLSAQVRKISPTPGFDPRSVQPVTGRYTDYAILAPTSMVQSRVERTKLRENIPWRKLRRQNQKHLYPKFNGYGDNGERNLNELELLYIQLLPNTY